MTLAAAMVLMVFLAAPPVLAQQEVPPGYQLEPGGYVCPVFDPHLLAIASTE